MCFFLEKKNLLQETFCKMIFYLYGTIHQSSISLENFPMIFVHLVFTLVLVWADAELLLFMLIKILMVLIVDAGIIHKNGGSNCNVQKK